MNAKSALGDTVMEIKFQYSNVMEMNDDDDGDGDDDDDNDHHFYQQVMCSGNECFL